MNFKNVFFYDWSKIGFPKTAKTNDTISSAVEVMLQTAVVDRHSWGEGLNEFRPGLTGRGLWVQIFKSATAQGLRRRAGFNIQNI